MNPGTKTFQRGSHQNPEDLSFSTFKVVRFSELEEEGTPSGISSPISADTVLNLPVSQLQNLLAPKPSPEMKNQELYSITLK